MSLTQEQIEKNYSLYKSYIQKYINRDGVENLLQWLDESDAKVAPSSTKYHSSFDGGNIFHSLNVFKRLIKLNKAEYPQKEEIDETNNDRRLVSTSPYSNETLTVVALFHDLAKVNFYKKSYKNVLNDDTGIWEKQPYYSFNEDSLFYSNHSANSIYLVKQFIYLTYEEEIAILYHMAGMDSLERSECSRAAEAFKKNGLALMLHIADMQATYIDEK